MVTLPLMPVFDSNGAQFLDASSHPDVHPDWTLPALRNLGWQRSEKKQQLPLRTGSVQLGQSVRGRYPRASTGPVRAKNGQAHVACMQPLHARTSPNHARYNRHVYWAASRNSSYQR